MTDRIIKICENIISFSFYSILFLVPVVFFNANYELFEFNKMWATFVLSLIVGGAWFTKIILQRKFSIQKTPLDIPIGLFLLSQIISTIFSLDSHVSFWGYYSRFNGGLLSIITYIFLYYAFTTNLSFEKIVKRAVYVSLASGVFVALWGLPSHFGNDPTCYIFRGSFDVSCWTNAFQPKVRIFSTLGQPDWLAAYLAILLPVSIILFIQNFKNLKSLTNLKTVNFALISILFYVDLVFTKSRSGFIAFWVSLVILIVIYALTNKKIFSKPAPVISVFALFLVITFFIGTPSIDWDKYTFIGLAKYFSKPATTNQVAKTATPSPEPAGEMGGTDSTKIRYFVWQGALDTWKNNPVFGTGVETFAFAYYKYKPVGHNLTSEWDYLYNKAHNEYLNFLATTGAFGLGTYLLMIGFFLYVFTRKVLLHNNLKSPLSLALFASYISILITNFFGFSVVITNIYLLLIPGFIFVLEEILPQKHFNLSFGNFNNKEISYGQWSGISLLSIGVLYLIFLLITFWHADTSFALGYNLDKIGQYQQAYPLLHSAVGERSGEPVFKDELSINDAILATGFYLQKDATTASKLAQEALAVSDEVTSQHPNNVIFWKTRVRLLYTLSQVNNQYLPLALNAIIKAKELAPNDPKISYNLGLLYGQTGDNKKAIETLQKTIELKKNYKDAYYALGLFYRQMAVDKQGRITNPELAQKASETMHYILTNISSGDAQVKQALKSWGENVD